MKLKFLMKIRLLFIFCFSLASFQGFGQEKQDSAKTEKLKWHYKPNFMVGIDVLNGAMAPFTDRKLLQFFVSTRFRRNLHLVVDAGFDKNIYQKNGYDAKVSGPFIKAGAFYMMVMDPENSFNGFYLGGKIAGSLYSQEYYAVPVRGSSGGDSSIAFPSSTQSSYWLEGTAGGRVRIFSSNFYIDVNLQPRYLVFTTKQESIKPMIVPGFGRSSAKFNMGFAWNIAYKF